LVINESTSFIGTLRNFIKPIIDEKSQITDLLYAVAPERIDPGNKVWNLSNTPRVISGLDDMASKAAVKFYENFCKNLHIVSKPEIAEAAKLIENTFRQVNIALANEISVIAANLKFSANDAILAASTKPFGFMPFYPSIGVGGHCIPIDPSYLIHSANQVGIESKLIEFANKINLDRPQVVISQIENYLGSTLTDKRIQVVGISYKIDVSDIRESPALTLISTMRSKGALVTWCDPIVGRYLDETSSPLDLNIDLGIVITPHSCIDLSVWRYAGTRVLDLVPNSVNYGWNKFL
jgi:UDP-N-acetyl-D-glucosamine dehydrogenase